MASTRAGSPSQGAGSICSTMSEFSPTLTWIDQQADRMRSMVVEFAGINSNTRNLEGIRD